MQQEKENMIHFQWRKYIIKNEMQIPKNIEEFDQSVKTSGKYSEKFLKKVG